MRAYLVLLYAKDKIDIVEITTKGTCTKKLIDFGVVNDSIIFIQSNEGEAIKTDIIKIITRALFLDSSKVNLFEDQHNLKSNYDSDIFGKIVRVSNLLSR